jgi:hypothetical protein
VSDLGENVQSQIYIYNINKIYIRLIVVSNTVQTDIYNIRLILASNTVQTNIYIKYAVERRDYRSCIGVCKVVARDHEQYSGVHTRYGINLGIKRAVIR